MRAASVGWRDIDLILDASNCRHQPIPCNAAYLQHALGAEASGIDPRSLSDADFDAVVQALAQHGVLVLRDQHLVGVVGSEDVAWALELSRGAPISHHEVTS